MMLQQILHYKGFKTTIRYSVADKVYFGKLEGIRDLVLFESKYKKDFQHEFESAVDEYVQLLDTYHIERG